MSRKNYQLKLCNNKKSRKSYKEQSLLQRSWIALPNAEDIGKSVAEGSRRHGADDQGRAEKGFDGFTGNDHDEVVQEAKADKG